MPKNYIGLIGLAVMGQNLVINIESKGYSVSVYNRTKKRTEEFIKTRAVGKNIEGTFTLKEFVNSLDKPRKIIFMIKAGSSIDDNINAIIPLLDKGDLIIDGGNTYYKDTIRREKILRDKGILYIGTGISGGEEGALKGPAIMPGGNSVAYNLVEDLFKKISAKALDGSPCVSHIGPDGAGHFVKMVHNGIEYGDMALIGECVWAMKSVLGYDALRISEIIKAWNDKNDKLHSYLIEITGESMSQKEHKSSYYLVDRIADITRMKGTGTWTVDSALELLVPVPTIASAVFSREMSQDKETRLKLSASFKFPKKEYSVDPLEFISVCHNALYVAKISSYAQGFALLSAASNRYNWHLNIGRIAAGWRAGCIIRAQFLSEITREYNNNQHLSNLISAPIFKDFIVKNIENLSKFIAISHSVGIPVPCMSSSLNYIYEITSPILVSAQVQAQQRDYFGAHGYFKLIQGKPKVLLKDDGSYKEYHTEWMKKNRPEKEI